MISRVLEQVTAGGAFGSAPDFNPDTVTPGVLGFIVTFLVAAAVVFLAIDMTRRIRRTRYRSEIGERLDAEVRAAGRSESDAPDPSATNPDGDPGGYRPGGDRRFPD